MLRAILFSCFSLIALPAAATCSGGAFLDRMTEADRELLATRVAATPFATGLLWKATKADQTLIVVGTMHIHDPRLDALFDRVVEYLPDTNLLLVEATSKEEAEMQAAIAQTPDLAFITDGPTLPERLDEHAWDALRTAASARGVPPFIAAKMQPWYLSLTLAIPPCAMPDLMSGKRGLDHMLMSQAEARDIPMQAVEPWTTLLDVMRSGTEAEQLEMLEMSVGTAQLQNEMFVSMLDAYFNEDTALIWEASRISTRYIPDIDQDRATALFLETEKLILNDRNAAWMPVVEAALSDNSNVMLAVGAAHLPGKEGVLNLLADTGWIITPLQ